MNLRRNLNIIHTYLLPFILVLIVVSSKDLIAQSRSLGNTFVHGQKEFSVFGRHHFTNGGNGIMPGIVGTKRNVPTYMSFVGNSSVAAVSDTAHVDGYVKNYVHQIFTFPIGDDNTYGPVSMVSPTAINISTPTSAAYFLADPDIAVTTSRLGGNEPPLPIGAPFLRSLRQTGITKVSPIEYWDVDGAAPTQLKFHWRSVSDIASLTNSMLMTLLLVGWDGTKWVTIPSTIDPNSNLMTGSITTNTAIIPNIYTAYTFAASCDLIDVVFSGIPEGLYLCEGDTQSIDVNVAIAGTDYVPEFILEKWNGLDWVSNGVANNDGVFLFSGLAANEENNRYRVKINFGTCIRYSDELVLYSYRKTSLSCKGAINASVDSNCLLNVTPSLLLTQIVNPIEFYEVAIKNNSGQSVQNPIISPVNGTIYTVSVIDRCLGNKCWSTVRVEDKLPPLVQNCHSSQSMACHEFLVISTETAGQHFGANTSFVRSQSPEVKDNCDAIFASFTDIISNNNSHCNGKSIERKWLFADKSGNQSSCTQIFNFTPLNLADVLEPIAQVTLDCKNNFNPSDINKTFDNPSTLDDVRSNSVIENNEGVTFAGFTYLAKGADGQMHRQIIQDNICNIYTQYTDEEIISTTSSSCVSERKIQRNWILHDDCTNTTKRFIQYIILKDTTKPEFVVNPMAKALSGDQCTASLAVAIPSNMSDDCTSLSNLKWYIEPPLGVIVIGSQPSYTLQGLKKGRHTITYIVADCSGNTTKKNTTVTITDPIGPTVITKENVVVALTGSSSNGGYARLNLESVNNGSYDNCGPIRMELRRKQAGPCNNVGNNGYNNNLSFSNWTGNNSANTWAHADNNNSDTDGGKYVTFCCEDIDAGLTYGLHEVELRVWDDANGNGIIGDTLLVEGIRDNYNISWSRIRVEYKIPPLIKCPIDAVVQCDQQFGLQTQPFLPVPAILPTGLPFATALCSDSFTYAYQDKWAGDSKCNVGLIQRTFRITNSQVSCIQNIKVLPHPTSFTVTFNEAGSYKWDKCNFTLEDARTALRLPVVTNSPCEQIGQNIEIDTYNLDGTSCKRWAVTYSYLNHCSGQIIQAPIISYYYNDTIAPQVNVGHSQKDIANECTAEVTLEARIKDVTFCGNKQNLSSNILIDLDNNNVIDYVAISESISGLTHGSWIKTSLGQNLYNQIKSFHNGVSFANELYVTYIPPVITNDSTLRLIPVVTPQGNNRHHALWIIKDECGNRSKQDYEWNTKDRKAPTPICVEISTSITSNNRPSVEVWAKDFIIKAEDNCNSEEELFFTFDSLRLIASLIHQEHFYKQSANGNVQATKSEYESGNAYKWLPEKRSSGRIINKNGINPIEVYTWDQAHNYNYCSTQLRVINNDLLTNISGQVLTLSGTSKSDATITLSSIPEAYSQIAKTDLLGRYEFNVPLNADYTISASYDGNYIDGVSTLDLVLIQRHILGVERHSDAYKMIASDANNDGKISVSDLVEIRKLILGTTQSFSNLSWRMPIKDQLLDKSKPFPYIEKLYEQQLLVPMEKIDFVAVKIGDINGSAKGNATNPYLESRTNKKLTFIADNVVLTAGEKQYIPIYANNFKNIFGFQTTINTSGVKILDIISENLNLPTDHFGKINEDLYTISYASNQPISFENNKLLFTLVLESKENILLQDVLKLTSEITRNESYDADLRVGSVAMEFRNNENSFTVYQNEPNPFIGSTSLVWMGITAENLKLKITDELGKVIMAKNIKSSRGKNTLTIDGNELPQSGIYYFTFSNNKNVIVTKKMVKVE